MIDALALAVQLGGDAPCSIKRMRGVDFINPPLQRQRGGRDRRRLIIEMGAVEAEQGRLADERQLLGRALQPAYPVGPRERGNFFFNQVRSVVSRPISA